MATDTDLAGALADTSRLTPFGSQSVRQVGVEMPGAAGGLRDPMKIDPQEFDLGDEGYLLLHWQVSKLRFEPIDKDDPAGDLRRVHVFDVDEAAIVDGEAYGTILREQRDRVRLAQEKAKGIARLDDPDRFAADHAAGKHVDLVKGCLACDEETDAEGQESTGG